MSKSTSIDQFKKIFGNELTVQYRKIPKEYEIKPEELLKKINIILTLKYF